MDGEKNMVPLYLMLDYNKTTVWFLSLKVASSK